MKKHTSKEGVKHHPKARVKKSGGASALDNLEIYAFWTGFASTIISLAGVLVQAFR